MNSIPLPPLPCGLFEQSTFDDLVAPVSEDQLKWFHAVDRALYCRLVSDLGGNPEQSMKLMAFWLFLERSKLVKGMVKTLLDSTDSLINSVAVESLLCINCMYNRRIQPQDPFLATRSPQEIPLLHRMSNSRITLLYFVQNRVEMDRGLDKLMRDVCLRAFDDLFRSAVITRSYYGYGQQHVNVNHNIDQQMSNLNIHNHNHMAAAASDPEVPADERTVLLNFSKGYPISQRDITNYFSNKYGDIVEEVRMEEVTAGEQPLHARMVLRKAAMVDVVMKGKQGSKTKYSIKGNYLWVRKYFNRLNAPSSSTTTTQAPGVGGRG